MSRGRARRAREARQRARRASRVLRVVRGLRAAFLGLLRAAAGIPGLASQRHVHAPPLRDAPDHGMTKFPTPIRLVPVTPVQGSTETSTVGVEKVWPL